LSVDEPPPQAAIDVAIPAAAALPASILMKSRRSTPLRMSDFRCTRFTPLTHISHQLPGAAYDVPANSGPRRNGSLPSGAFSPRCARRAVDPPLRSAHGNRHPVTSRHELRHAGSPFYSWILRFSTASRSLCQLSR
jgi:hypothetical protein